MNTKKKKSKKGVIEQENCTQCETSEKIYFEMIEK